MKWLEKFAFIERLKPSYPKDKEIKPFFEGYKPFPNREALQLEKDKHDAERLAFFNGEHFKSTDELKDSITSHPPYIESDAFREEVKMVQRLKGAEKYPELFDPDSHTDEELAVHAMSEFHDGQEYVAGLRKRMKQLRAIIFQKDLRIQELEATVLKHEQYIEDKLKGECRE